MLATLQALVSQALRTASSLEEAGASLTSRIQAMASANDLLVNERWETAAIEDVIERALAPFRGEGDDRIRIDGPALRLAPRVAVGLALALHELATNAAKYGALSTGNGRVEVRWDVAASERPHRLHFTWQELGGPVVVTPTRVGFGSKLITRVLASELGGTTNLDYHPDGVVFTATAPLPDPDEDSRP
jgi:two-component sensor histidine kinase